MGSINCSNNEYDVLVVTNNNLVHCIPIDLSISIYLYPSIPFYIAILLSLYQSVSIYIKSINQSTYLPHLFYLFCALYVRL